MSETYTFLSFFTCQILQNPFIYKQFLFHLNPEKIEIILPPA